MVPCLDPLTGYGEIFAQGMAVEVIGQHDAAQVGVVAEVDAEEIEDLALIPVGAAPDGRYGIDRWGWAAHSGFDAEARFLRDRVEMVDDFEARFGGVTIDGGHGGETLKAMGFEGMANVDDAAGGHFQGPFVESVLMKSILRSRSFKNG